MEDASKMKVARRDAFKFMAALAAQSGCYAEAAPPSRIRLVVLDTGGTIIADQGDVPEALEAAFAKHGVKVSPEDIAKWRGASKREIVRNFAGENLTEAIYADFNARLIEAYKKVPPIAGVEAAFVKMRDTGLLLAATTGFDRQVASSIFQRLGWEKYFTAVITSDDVTLGRPAPYLIFHAMEKARVEKVSEVIAVGDTPLDLQAAANAGVRGAVGVLSGASKRERLEGEPHTDILGSVASLPELISAKY